MCHVLLAAGPADRSRAPTHLEGAESPASEIQPRDQRRTEAVLCHEQREFTLNLQLKTFTPLWQHSSFYIYVRFCVFYTILQHSKVAPLCVCASVSRLLRRCQKTLSADLRQVPGERQQEGLRESLLPETMAQSHTCSQVPVFLQGNR